MRDAVLQLLVEALRADGVIQQSEREAFAEALEATGLFPDQDAQELLQGSLPNCPRVEELAALVPDDMRTRVFGLCADLAVADGRLGREETRLLDRIRQGLRLSRESADHLLASATSRRVLRERP